MKLYYYYLLCLLSLSTLFSAPQQCNLFDPYEWILDPVRFGCFGKFDNNCCPLLNIVISARGEFSYNPKSFYLDYCNNNPSNQSVKKGNPLQMYGIYENTFAPFLGFSPTSDFGSFSQQYSRHTGCNPENLICLDGNIQLNQCVVTIEKWFTPTIRLGWYVPYYWMNVSNICIQSGNSLCDFEQRLIPLPLTLLQTNTTTMQDYSLNGIGDSQLLISWQDNFYEYRDFITGITCALRAGFSLPTDTKKCQAQETLLKIPLGYNAAWGILCGGSLEVDTGCYLSAGISADFNILFGNIANRYIKTDIRQTTLLLPAPIRSFLDPGILQKFQVYCATHDKEKKYNLTLGYIYNKQHDSDIIVCDDSYSTLIASTCQNLDPWTVHSLVADFHIVNPFDAAGVSCGIFAKWGVFGTRCIAFDTIGIFAYYDF